MAVVGKDGRPEEVAKGGNCGRPGQVAEAPGNSDRPGISVAGGQGAEAGWESVASSLYSLVIQYWF